MNLAKASTERKFLCFMLALQLLLGLTLVVKIERDFRVPMMPEGVCCAGSFSEGLAQVGIYAGSRWTECIQITPYFKYGFINREGRLVIACEYDEVWDFSDGYAKVSRDGKTGFIDHSGAPAFPLSELYSKGFLGDFHEGMAVFKGKKSSQRMIDGEMETEEFEGWGFIGVNGKWRIDPVFDFCGPFSGGVAVVKYQGHWGFVTAGRKLKICRDYQSIDTFREGLAAFEKEGKWGFIDITGKELIANQFHWVEGFQGGLSAVEAAEPGFVTRSGKFLTADEGVKLKASPAKQLSPDLSHWALSSRYPGYLNPDGTWAIRPNVPWKIWFKGWCQKLW